MFLNVWLVIWPKQKVVIANAVANALSSLGAEPCVLPLSPSRVWELVQAARK